eukprot:5113_1
MTKLGLEIDSHSSSLTFNRSNNAVINTLEVSINRDSKILNVYMNDEIMLFTSNVYGVNINIGDISINYNELNVIIRCQFGLFIQIWLRNIDAKLQFIEYTVDVDAKYQNEVTGLVGNYDTDDSNDLQARNGTILTYMSTMEQIHYNFGLSWLLNNNDNNIFHDEFISEIDPFEYKPLFGFDDIDDALFQIATEKCGNEFECLYDVVATQVVAIANTTLKFVEFTHEVEETMKIIYNITEIITPSPTLEGCIVAESMNLYLLVNTNCNLINSQCIDQQVFISTLLEKIKSNDKNIEQLFGYIEYGNGANQIFSVRDELNNDFPSILQTIRQMKDCHNLNGAINHPYFAIQTAINDFKNISNNHNNIILMISACAPNLETTHSCSLKETFDDENIKLFVINNNNDDSYQCLVKDINNQIVNINDYNINNVNNVINNICSWIGITPTPVDATLSSTDNPTTTPTNPTTTPTNNPTTTPSNNHTTTPSNNPTTTPSNKHTTTPSNNPTTTPSNNHTTTPSNNPTTTPSNNHTTTPSNNPTTTPTNNPTTTPTNNPTTTPTNNPTTTP